MEIGGIEDGGIGGAVAPLTIQEGIGAEVDDYADFEVLPGGLLRAWLDVGEILRRGVRGE